MYALVGSLLVNCANVSALVWQMTNKMMPKLTGTRWMTMTIAYSMTTNRMWTSRHEGAGNRHKTSANISGSFLGYNLIDAYRQWGFRSVISDRNDTLDQRWRLTCRFCPACRWCVMRQSLHRHSRVRHVNTLCHLMSSVICMAAS